MRRGHSRLFAVLGLKYNVFMKMETIWLKLQLEMRCKIYLNARFPMHIRTAEKVLTLEDPYFQGIAKCEQSWVRTI